MCTHAQRLAISASILTSVAAGIASAAVVNGGFESGLLGWTTADQVGSDGAFFVQSGAASPLNAFPVPAPPTGVQAAMTDAGAGGSHVLYQDLVIPAGATGGSIQFSLYLNNAAGSYFTPATLDWAATNPAGGLNLNQQARVDLLTTASDAFSIAPADVLQTLFQTDAQTPAVLGYSVFALDISTVLAANAGTTIRLRFAEVDNVSFFNMGVDDVSLVIIPPPGALASVGIAVAWPRRRRGR